MASSSHLEPGESGSIKASVRTAGKSGHLIKTVKVTSNDPSNKLSNLRLKMFVKVPASAAGSHGASAIRPRPTRTLPRSADDTVKPATSH